MTADALNPLLAIAEKRITKRTLEERFWRMVDQSDPDGCWPWKGVPGPGGYGHIYDGKYETKKKMYAHRLSYELMVGPIPAGLQIDHLCRNRICVNPWAFRDPEKAREAQRRWRQRAAA